MEPSLREQKHATWESMRAALDQAAGLQLPELQKLPSKDIWQGSTARTLGIRGYELRRLDNSLQKFGKARAEYESRAIRNEQRLAKLRDGQGFGGVGSKEWHKEAQRYFDGQKKVLQAYEAAVGALDQSIERFDSWKQHSFFSYKRLNAKRDAVGELQSGISKCKEHFSGYQEDAARSRSALTTANRTWRGGRSTLNSLHRAGLGKALGQIFRGHLNSGSESLRALYAEPARHPPSTDFLQRPPVARQSGPSVATAPSQFLRHPIPSRSPALSTVDRLNHAAMSYDMQTAQQRSNLPRNEVRYRPDAERLQQRSHSPRPALGALPSREPPRDRPRQPARRMS